MGYITDSIIHSMNSINILLNSIKNLSKLLWLVFSFSYFLHSVIETGAIEYAQNDLLTKIFAHFTSKSMTPVSINQMEKIRKN